MDPDRRDLLGDEPDDRYGDDHGDDHGDGDAYDDDLDEKRGGETVLHAVLAPEALALASLVLAAISLMGLGLLNGPPYLPQSFFADQPQRSTLITASLLGAALALLPAGLGVLALRRLPHGAAARVVAGAGVLLAGIAVLLRLVLTARTVADDSVQFVQF